jgi:hypothetical protein
MQLGCVRPLRSLRRGKQPGFAFPLKDLAELRPRLRPDALPRHDVEAVETVGLPSSSRPATDGVEAKTASREGIMHLVPLVPRLVSMSMRASCLQCNLSLQGLGSSSAKHPRVPA